MISNCGKAFLQVTRTYAGVRIEYLDSCYCITKRGIAVKLI